MKALAVKLLLSLISWETIDLSPIELFYLFVDISGQLLRMDQANTLEIVVLHPAWCVMISSSECVARIKKRTEVTEVGMVAEQIMKEPEVSVLHTECREELASQRNVRTVIAKP